MWLRIDHWCRPTSAMNSHITTVLKLSYISCTNVHILTCRVSANPLFIQYHVSCPCVLLHSSRSTKITVFVLLNQQTSKWTLHLQPSCASCSTMVIPSNLYSVLCFWFISSLYSRLLSWVLSVLNFLANFLPTVHSCSSSLRHQVCNLLSC